MWRTDHEIAFIKNMGKTVYDHKFPPHLTMVKSYAKAITKRTHWGHIQKTVIIDFLRAEYGIVVAL